MSKSKRQGTAWERAVRVTLATFLRFPIVRLAEEGLHDRGDLALVIGRQEIVVECRDRETMQVHNATAKAKAKAGKDAWVIVAWKRKKLKPGNQVRTQVGAPVGIMPMGDLLMMLQRLHHLEERIAQNEKI